MKRYIVLTAMLVLCICTSVAAEDISKEFRDSNTFVSVSEGDALYVAGNTSVVATTHFDGEKFKPAKKEAAGEDQITYSSNETFLFVFPDPAVKQEYVIQGNGTLKETLTIKEPMDISYSISMPVGASLQRLESGDYKIVNPAVDERVDGYIVVEKPFGVDANGQMITGFEYLNSGNNLSIIFPEKGDNGNDIAYPLTIDPILYHMYDLKLLLHGNLEPPSMSASDFRDSSHSFMMPYGTLQFANINASQIKFGNGSIFVKTNASTFSNQSCVVVPDNSAFDFGTNNYSISGWYYMPSWGQMDIYRHYQDATHFEILGTNAANQVSFYAQNGATSWSVVASPYYFKTGAWNHLAFIQNGTTGTLYLNGTAVGTATRGTANPAVNAPVFVGNGTHPMAGHIDEVMVFNGGFAPTIDQLYSAGEYPLYLNGTLGGYGDDDYTVSLLHFDDVNRGVNFTDQISNRSWTVPVGAPNMTTSQYKFGPSSVQAPGLSLIRTSYDPQFDFGTGDFTIEGWVYAKDTAGISPNSVYPFWAGGYGSSVGYCVIYYAWAGVYLQSNASGTFVPDCAAGGHPFQLNTWEHWAVERSGTSIKIFRDGQLDKTCTIPASYRYNSYRNVSDISLHQNMSYDEIRITKGTARYSSNFTPPASPFGITSPSWTSDITAYGPGAPKTVTFNDTTPDSAWTNNTFLWNFGDGTSSWNRNETHTYVTNGVFLVNLTTFNNNMTATSASTTITMGAPDVDFAASPTTGTAALQVEFTDLTTNVTPITAYNLSFGDGTFTTDPPVSGKWRHVYASFGSYSVNLTETNSIGTGYEYKRDYIVTSTEQTQFQSSYTPGSIAFTVYNRFGQKIPNADVTVNYVSTSLPDGLTFLTKTYGINNEIAQSILSTNTTHHGTTGSDGSISFYLHPCLKYNVNVSSGTSMINESVYPKEDYSVWLPEGYIENTLVNITTDLTIIEPNTSFITLIGNYYDTAGSTSQLIFYVNKSDKTPVYQNTTAFVGSSNHTDSFTVPNVRGEGYYWGVRAIRGSENVSMDRGVTGKGPSGMLVDLKLVNPAYYPWIALFILGLLTSLASKNNIRFIGILMPSMAAIFVWFGWLSGAYLATVVPLCACLGVIYYMKGSLRENYGIGAPGSLLVIIVFYLIMLQLAIGMVNGLGVFDQASQITPSNKFTNIELTDLQEDVENFGGINDNLQQAAAFASMTYTVIKIFLSMIGAVFFIMPYLTKMFPYVPASFFLVLQGGIYFLYVLMVAKLIGRTGPETEL